MTQDLAGIKIAVLGGDLREVEFARILIERGAILHLAGLPKVPELAGAVFFEELANAVKNVDAVIGPATGTDSELKLKTLVEGRKFVLNEEVFANMPVGTLFYIGSAQPALRSIVQKYGIRLREYMERDELAILNAIPTAEGAIKIAIEKMPITLHGCKALVIGLGRIGLPLLRRLVLLGAETFGVDRKKSNLARAIEHGAKALDFSQLAENFSQFDVIFNTVPALILTRDLLQNANPQVLIVDLASAPGGTDFAVAQDLGIEAILALGLPGKFSPKTAGRILAKVIPELLFEDLRAF